MKVLFFAIIAGLFLSSCKVSDSPVSAPVKLSETDLNHISVTPISVDSILVQSDSQFLISSPTITKIVPGELLGDIFNQDKISNSSVIDTIKPTFEKVGDQYLVKFSKVIPIPITKLIYNLGLRFYDQDGNYFDVKKIVNMPASSVYPSAELVVMWSEFEPFSWVEDFCIQNSNLYYMDNMQPGIFGFDMINKTSMTVIPNVATDHTLDLYKNYFYVDIQSYYVQRYNLLTGGTDLKVHPDIANYQLSGVTATDSVIYVIVSSFAAPQTYLLTYSDSLKLLTQKYIPLGMELLTNYNGILYSWDYQANALLRYDLSSGSFLKAKKMPIPVDDLYGYKIYNNYLYFNNRTRHFIGRVPLSDLQDAD